MLVLIRGAGDIASGIALRLWRCGFSVVMTELKQPTSIRRTVCFSEAVRLGSAQVEEATAVFAVNADAAFRAVRAGNLAVLADPDGACRALIGPGAVVDARLAKRNIDLRMTDAPIVIGVGPGFCAGVDCHAVVETMRGHDLGRVRYDGCAAVNTGVPGNIGGYTVERILRAPADGVMENPLPIGAAVQAGDTVATVGGVPMRAAIGGVLRGMLPAGTPVVSGMKSGDVDPRGDAAFCARVSDKALAVAGGVLEALLHLSVRSGS